MLDQPQAIGDWRVDPTLRALSMTAFPLLLRAAPTSAWAAAAWTDSDPATANFLAAVLVEAIVWGDGGIGYVSIRLTDDDVVGDVRRGVLVPWLACLLGHDCLLRGCLTLARPVV